MSGTLYMVAVPIGNLHDMTERAAQTLRAVDIVAAEDTRVTGKLLALIGIKKPLMRCDEQAPTGAFIRVRDTLMAGGQVAFVSDAGTPGIADPGGALVAYVVRHVPGARIVPIPGVSAVATALSVAGMPADRFIFLGFPPHKKRRATFFTQVGVWAQDYTVVLYESPHRIRKTAGELKAVVPPAVTLCFCRELTKKFEEIRRMSGADLVPDDLPEKGEYVIVIGSSHTRGSDAGHH